jgi:hypothetical protein
MRKITLLLLSFLMSLAIVAQDLVFTNLWEFSVQSANLGTAVDDVKNGIAVSPDGTNLYLGTRTADASQVAVYSAATGVRSGYLPGLTGFASTYGGDVAVDGNGAIYASSVIISAAALKVARWASPTATPETFISTTAHTGSGTNRVGYGMAVRVNQEGDGFLIMHKNGTADFLIWLIDNNVPVSQDPTVLTATLETGIAITDSYGRISMVNDNSFWFDGNVTRPQLVTITKNGTAINSAPTALSYTTLAFRSDVNAGVGGTAEFMLEGSRYLVLAANNHGTTFTEGHMARFQKMMATGVAVDGNVLATFPAAGLGKTSDASHFVEPAIYVNGTDAYVYLLGGFNGISAHKVSAPGISTSTTGTSVSSMLRRTESGVAIELKKDSKVEIFSITGATIVSTRASGLFTHDLNEGLYIIRVNGKAAKFVK